MRHRYARHPPREALPQAPPSDIELHLALTCESERICQLIRHSRALKRVVRFKPTLGIHAPIHRTQATLTLTLENVPPEQLARNPIDSRLPEALRGFSTILAHSVRLNKFPALKGEFWSRVIKSMLVMQRESHNVEKMRVLFEDEGFPLVRVDMHRGGPMTKSHMETISRFLTTPPEHEMDDRFVRQCEQLASDKIRVGLLFGYSFSGIRMSPTDLRLLEEMLDRVFASPTRQFAVDLLELERQGMDAKHLEVIASIVRKNSARYGLKCLQLTRAVNTKQPCDQALGVLQNIVAAACTSNLKRLELDSNPLGVEHFAALCSSLRYGCQLEAIGLCNTLSAMSSADRKQCWRWLAFGIFYPRSRKLAADNTFRHIEISYDHFEPEDCAAFAKTLLDPAGELVYQGESAQSTAKDEILLCTVKQGATFYPSTVSGEGAVYQLSSENELEALCQQEGWTCAVIPGVGLGWVTSDQIVSTEREPIGSSHRSAVSVEWTFVNATYRSAPSAALFSFLEHVGHCLSYLSMADSITREPEIVPAILRHCVNLKHLRLCQTNLPDNAIDLLVTALNGDLGDRLLSLDLSERGRSELSGRTVEKIAAFLSNTARIPALFELRIAGTNLMTGQAYKSLHHALEVNKTLRILELPDPNRYFDFAESDSDEDLALDAFDAIERGAQGEILPSILPLSRKLAFLSAIQHRSSVGKACHELDSFMVSRIFRLAADTIRRRVVWVELYPPETPPDEYSSDVTESDRDEEIGDEGY